MVDPKDIEDEFVDEVEHDCGMGCGAWDCVDPKEVIAAAINVYLLRQQRDAP